MWIISLLPVIKRVSATNSGIRLVGIAVGVHTRCYTRLEFRSHRFELKLNTNFQYIYEYIKIDVKHLVCTHILRSNCSLFDRMCERITYSSLRSFVTAFNWTYIIIQVVFVCCCCCFFFSRNLTTAWPELHLALTHIIITICTHLQHKTTLG